MGRPKGLCRLPGASGTFLQTLVATYAAARIPVAVVAGRDDLPAYQRLLPPGSGLDVAWLGADTRGDTARTALLARQAWPEASHYWLQPVDLPLLRPETVRLLAAASHREPARIVRPARGAVPGHPVIVPHPVLAGLERLAVGDERLAAGPLRDIIETATTAGELERPRIVAVEDPGVVRDFDSPADLEPGPSNDGKEA